MTDGADVSPRIVCPRCASAGVTPPGEAHPVVSLPGVSQCTRCDYRVAYGEEAPRTTVYADGLWRCVTFVDDEKSVCIRMDAGLAKLIALNLLNLK